MVAGSGKAGRVATTDDPQAITVLAAGFAGIRAVEAAQHTLVTWLEVGTVLGGALQFQLPAVLRLNRGVPLSLRTSLPGVEIAWANRLG